MKILMGNYIYESHGIPYSDEDVKELLESHNVTSLQKLNTILEAIEKKNADEKVPDLEATPEEQTEEEKMAAQQNNGASPENVPDLETPAEEPVDAPAEKPQEEPDAAPVETPEEVPEPKEAPTEKPPKETPKPVAPPKDPPAIEPKATLPVEDKAPTEWLPNKKLSTLYNNFIDFFDGQKSLNSAGTIIGLEAPGLKQDSKYVQCDVTAFVQGTEEKPYSVWIKLRRQRNTQNWSFNNPCEVRCNCKAFAYFLGYSNLKNKSLAGPPVKGKRYRDENGIMRTLNFLLPAKQNNPAAVPALCKHLALVAKRLLDNGMLTED